MLNKLFITFFFSLFLSANVFAEEGKPLDISAYKGKVVLVDFWASWCAPCRKSFPWLNDMQKQYASKGLVILGVNVDENPQDAQRFLKENPAIFKLIYDPKGQHASFYDLPGMPTTLIFDRQGKLAHRHSGFLTAKVQEYEQLIVQSLATK